MAFRLPPGGAEQLIAYDAAAARYAPLCAPRPLAVRDAALVLAPALALRALGLRPRGACLNQPLGAAGPPAAPGAAAAQQLAAGGPANGAEVAGDGGSCAHAVRQSAALVAEECRSASSQRPAGGSLLTAEASAGSSWEAVTGVPPDAREVAFCGGAEAGPDAAAAHAAGAAHAEGLSHGAETGAPCSAARTPTAAELWAGYQTAQVGCFFVSHVLCGIAALKPRIMKDSSAACMLRGCGRNVCSLTKAAVEACGGTGFETLPREAARPCPSRLPRCPKPSISIPWACSF